AAEEPGGAPGGLGLVVEADPLDELADLHRLDEVVVDAALEGREAVGDVAPAGQHDHGRVPAELAADAAAHHRPGAAGHGGVDDHHRRLVQPGGGHGLVAVGGGDRPVPVHLEGDTEQATDGLV